MMRRLIPAPSPAWLVLPALGFTLLVFGVPLLHLLRMSFNTHPPDGIYELAWSLENYVAVLTDPVNLRTIRDTVLLSLITAVVTVVLAFLFAHAVWKRKGRVHLVLLAIALCPMLVSEISVIIGWRMFFPANGFLSYALVGTGLAEQKVNLLGTRFAAIVGLSYISVSYCFLTILSVMNAVDRDLITASGDLGASPLRTFLRVLVPLTMGGIIGAFTQAFVFSMGIYAAVNALGPDSLWSIGYEIQRQMLSRRDWPLASAFAVVLIVLISLTVIGLHALRNRRGPRHD
ncbi:ABC transporter permease [Pseudogemmobacter humi]|uniref:Spermidine/putrescine transport system permease protein PotB n=1 Tax=Pseudogemmobacter humi TaxID=2483812 RepID=A0A3P5XXQ8_9RHOB|nr:ABC transporter permease [Pseudogemmobacter humi]VDC33922.1 Spermidine/putrescine transport system permease protein PotB [Pseudogemmobacter humi]